MLAYIMAFQRKRFDLITNALIHWKLSKQIIRYEKVHWHGVNLLLLLLFSLSMAFAIAVYYGGREQLAESLSSMPTSWLWVMAYILLKIIIYRLSSWLFQQAEIFQLYLFQVNLILKYCGIGLFILLVFTVYLPIGHHIFSYLLLSILAAFLCLQLVRGVQIGKAGGIPLYLIILYLCSLEILPWLLLIKVLI
jgi:hypothetical protein